MDSDLHVARASTEVAPLSQRSRRDTELLGQFNRSHKLAHETQFTSCLNLNANHSWVRVTIMTGEGEFKVTDYWTGGADGIIRVDSHPTERFGGQILPPGFAMLVRVAPLSKNPDRLVPTEIYLFRRDGAEITSKEYGQVKFGQLDKLINDDSVRAAITLIDSAPGELLRWGNGVSVEEWSPPLGPFEASGWTRELPEVDAHLPLSERGSDEFYARVAEVYKELVKARSDPGVVVADANAVPVTTAHYWFREARKRELLPPGRRGRAG